MKMVLDDELQALLLLSSLPDSWETLVVTISNSTPDGKVTIDMVKDRMFNEEARRKEHGFSAESQALVIERRERNNSRQHHNNKPRDNSRGRSKSRKEIECYHYGKTGHMKREYRKLKRE